MQRKFFLLTDKTVFYSCKKIIFFFVTRIFFLLEEKILVQRKNNLAARKIRDSCGKEKSMFFHNKKIFLGIRKHFCG